MSVSATSARKTTRKVGTMEDGVCCALVISNVNPAHQRKRRQVREAVHILGDSHGDLLLKTPAVKQALHASGYEGPLDVAVPTMVGLVVVKPGVWLQSPTSVLSKQERLLWSWYKHRSDVFTVSVQHSQRFDPFFEVSNGDDLMVRSCGILEVSATMLAKMRHALPTDAALAFKIALQEAKSMLAFVLPSVIALPLATGRWQSWMLCRAIVTKHPRLWPSWPPFQFWSFTRSPLTFWEPHLPEGEALSTRLRDVADKVRGLAASSQGQTLEDDDLRLLDALAAHHSNHWQVRPPHPRQRPLEMLVEVVLLSRLLRSQDTFRKVLHSSLRLLSKGGHGEHLHTAVLEERLRNGNCGADVSRSSVHRARVKLDLAFALLSRSLFKSPCITGENTAIGPYYYMWADASPQAGREWLLSHIHILLPQSHRQLCQLLFAINSLAKVLPVMWHEWQTSIHAGLDHSEAKMLVQKMPPLPIQESLPSQGSAHSQLVFDDGGMCEHDFNGEVATAQDLRMPCGRIRNTSWLLGWEMSNRTKKALTFLSFIVRM